MRYALSNTVNHATLNPRSHAAHDGNCALQSAPFIRWMAILDRGVDALWDGNSAWRITPCTTGLQAAIAADDGRLPKRNHRPERTARRTARRL